MSLSTDALEEERNALKEQLRSIEADQRAAEAALRSVRQRELRVKREIEALSTLIELRSTDAPSEQAVDAQ